MRAFLAILALLLALTCAHAQDYAPSSLKLTGVTLKATPEGYFVLSLPLKDIPTAIKIIARVEPHMAVVEMMERLSHVAVRANRFVSRTPEVPNGLVFLASAEVFTVRHKVIDRFVTRIGFCHFPNSRGQMEQVPAYQGGPAQH